jgi:hypothetical protein
MNHTTSTPPIHRIIGFQCTQCTARFHQPADDLNRLCTVCRYPICHNDIPGSTCSSVERGEPMDMRLGDTCVLCCCWDCERCDKAIDLDCEVRVMDEHGGYEAVCEKCVTKEDTLYDD